MKKNVEIKEEIIRKLLVETEIKHLINIPPGRMAQSAHKRKIVLIFVLLSSYVQLSSSADERKFFLRFI